MTYDLKEWAAETVDGRRLFNAGFRMLPGDFADWELVKAIPFEAALGANEFVYMWQRDDGRELLRVQIAELGDWQSAQQRLLEDLRMSMRPDIPRATSKLGRLGDVAYVARSPDTDVPAAVSFARGNVYASIRSVGDRETDVSDAALWLDETLGQAPGRGAERGPRRVSERRREDITARRADTESVVIRNVAGVAKEAWLQALAGAGELRRREDALVYVATEPDARAARVDLYTYEASSEGPASRRSPGPRRKRTR